MSHSFIKKPDQGSHSALSGLGVLSTERAALPPLPEPFAWMKRFTERFDGEWDAYDFSVNQFGDFTSPLYTAEQVEQIRRETVQACAAIAEANGEDEPYGHAKFRCANIAAEILALLPVKEPNE